MTDSPRVLIIEDDTDAAELTARRLAAASIATQTCLGVEGSLNAFEAGQFAVVILDVDMPGLEGTKLIQGLWERALERRPQILLYSNYDAESLAKATRQHGANAWLQKSAGKELLVDTVQRLLDAPAASRA